MILLLWWSLALCNDFKVRKDAESDGGYVEAATQHSERMCVHTEPSSPQAPLHLPPSHLHPPSPLEHSLTSVNWMKQVTHSSSVERMWQAGNGQDKEGIYEVLVNLNNSLNEGPQE